MEKDNSQFSTKEYKKLRRRLKFMVWVNKTFTKDVVIARVHGILLGISVGFAIISFMSANLLGGFGFLLATLWGFGSWTAYLVKKEEKPKEDNFLNSDLILKSFDLLASGGEKIIKQINKEEDNKEK